MIENATARATSWFQIHADQRIKLMNFFVILLAGSLALFGSAIIDDNYILGVVVSVSILIIAFVFKNLDRRTASIVEDAERALHVLEEKFAEELNIAEIKLVEAASVRNGILSYRQSFNILFGLGYFLGALGLAHGAFQLYGDLAPVLSVHCASPTTP